MKSTNIFVSIIVPVYNSELTIGKCLDSLINQTYRDIEIICVDDCSTDSSPHILKEYAKKDQRIAIIEHKRNLNAGGGRNSGIQAATGQYISFVDSDDWLKEYAFELLVNATDYGEYDVVSSPLTDYKSDGTTIREEHMVPSTDKATIIEHMMKHGMRMLGCLFKRSLFVENDIIYPENVYFEDNAIGMAPFMLANSIKVIEESVYCYKAYGESSSRSFSTERCMHRILTTRMIIENAKKYGFYDEYKALVDFRYLYLTPYTIELISYLPYTNARRIIRTVKEDIEHLLPNPFFGELLIEDQKIITNPLKYIKHQYICRLLSKQKKFIHKIRHMTVVCIKKCIGMDPSESFFNWKCLTKK